MYNTTSFDVIFHDTSVKAGVTVRTRSEEYFIRVAEQIV